jgi:YHS domain-containing protein
VLRFVALAILGCLVFLVLRATLSAFVAGFRGGSRGSQPRQPSQALRDDLVKDPVCETYIPRRKAVARTTAGNTYYFCSAGCADRFTAA